MRFELGPEAEAVLLDLSLTTGRADQYLLAEAIGLLVLVVRAKQAGKRVVVVGTDGPETDIQLECTSSLPTKTGH